MRTREINLLVLVVLLTSLAMWINLAPRATPGDKNDRRELWLGRDVHSRMGLDLRGGTQVLLQASEPISNAAVLQQARKTIEQRVNGLGVTEASVQTSGENRIIVELPDVTDPTVALQAIRSTGELDFVDPGSETLNTGQLVRTSDNPNPRVNVPTASAGITGTAALSQTTQTTTVITTGAILPVIADGALLDTSSVNVGFDTTGSPYVSFAFTGAARQSLQAFTANSVGKPMAIILDNRVQSVATIQAALPGEGQITTNSVADRDAIFAVLKYGSLPVSFDVQSSRTINATLGEESVDASTLAGIIGLVAVAIFMLVYYRLPGLVADITLLIYTALTFALYRFIPITLTLAGIAGFVLSVGLAVDANVLIFSRLKDELRRGLPLPTAVERSFIEAWPSIRDSNASTLITSLILYWFGSSFGVSIIKGFALTLALGIMVSLFTAVVVTRTFLRLIVASGRFRNPWFYAVGDTQPKTTAQTVMES